MPEDTALDIVLASYRDVFGVKTERGNELHRDACIEVARLRDENARARRAFIMAAFDTYYEEVGKITLDKFMALPRVSEYIDACIQEWYDRYKQEAQEHT